jgi:prepilin-type N-terminal cleavage/methylation domain-containing protein
MRRQMRGYTIAEMVVVLVIAGIVSAIALPNIDYRRYRADAATHTLRGTLQHAQRLSIVRQYDVIVVFDLVGRRMRIIEDANNNRAADSTERVIVRPVEEGITFIVPPMGVNGPVSTPIVGANLRNVDGLPSITFHRNGSASSDLELYLSALSAHASDIRAVVVTQSTGRAQGQRYLGSSWSEEGL